MSKHHDRQEAHRTAHNETQQLASFASRLQFESIPTEVVDRAKIVFLNVLACALRGQGLTSSTMVRDLYGQMGGSPDAWAAGAPVRIPAAAAAALNCHAAYATMNDDSFREGVCHPGKATVPAAFAIAEEQGTSGKEFLTALVAGLEVGCRAAASLCQTPEAHKTRIGWQCTVADGFFGTSACSRVLRLSPDDFQCALGISASSSSGLHETSPPTQLWPWDGGRAAYQSVLAARLAHAGMTANIVLEGPLGHIDMFTAHRADLSLAAARLVRGLGEEWSTLDVGIKTRCASYLVHNAIEAAQLVVLENNVPLERIRSLTLRQGTATAGDDPWVVSDYDTAVFSLAFDASVAILDGDPLTLPDDIVAHLDDRRVQDLTSKLRFEPGDSVDAPPGEHVTATALLETIDGTAFERQVAHTRWTHPDSLTPDALFFEKFRRNAQYSLPSHRVERLLEIVAELETLSDVRLITQELTAG